MAGALWNLCFGCRKKRHTFSTGNCGIPPRSSSGGGRTRAYGTTSSAQGQWTASPRTGCRAKSAGRGGGSTRSRLRNVGHRRGGRPGRDLRGGSFGEARRLGKQRGFGRLREAGDGSYASFRGGVDSSR